MKKSLPTQFRQETAYWLAPVRTTLRGRTGTEVKNRALLFALCLTLLSLSQTGMAQLTGIKTIPGDYASVAAAVTDLNAQGVGAGGVTFNVAAGHTEATDVPEIEATGTAADPIIFQKSGPGANPVITRLTPGTVASSTTIGNNGDGIIVINGGDYITFDGIDVQTDPTFSGVGYMEYGFYLKKASGDDACKNVTIKNCNITLDKAAIYSFGVYVSNNSGTTAVTVTSTGGRSENIKIFNTNISNVYSGIQLRGFNHTTAPFDFYDQNIEVGEDGGNTITNFGGGGSTVYGIYTIYQNDCKLNNNTIIGGDGTTSTQWGIFVSTSNNGNFDINNNTVSLTNNSTTSQVVGIGTSITTTNHTDNTINITGNTVTNFSRPSATTGVTYFIYSTANSPVNFNITNNTIGSSTFVGTGAVYGISQISTPPNLLIDGNTISNITREGATATALFYGINCTGSSTTLNSTISNNTIHSLTGNGSTGAVGGINLGSNATCNVFKNKIYNITSDHNSGTVYGITVGAVTDGNIYNNLIGGLKAPNTGDATPTNPRVRGINITSTLANSTRNVSFNTIYLDATSVGTNFGTAGVMTLGSTIATSGVLQLRNNIIVNNSVANGTGNTVAYQRSTTALDNYGSDSNNNLFYAGTPGPSNLIFFDGTNADETLDAFKARVAPLESLSVTENPAFLSLDGPSANFLHINPAVPTQVESGAGPIAGIDDDFDGDPRNATTPDIGADEGNFILVDLTGPNITYDDIPNSICIGSIGLSAEITDASGVDGAVGTRPRLWFKKSTEANVLPPANTSAEDGWKWVEASNVSSPFSFTINYSLLTSPVASGDVIEYFVVAQDLVATPNVGTNTAIYPAGFTPASVALESAAFPVSAFKSYSIINAPVTITTVASPDQICISGDVTLSLAGDPSTGAEYQWQSSPAGANNWTPIPGANADTYTTAVSSSTDFRCVISCGGTPIAASPSTTATVTVSNPMVLTTTPGGECGPGPISVMLGATGSAGAELNWYDVPTGGSSLGMGTTFNTPPISMTTTYYVGANEGGGTENAAKPTYSTTPNTSGNQWGLEFDVVTTDIVIQSVEVYSVGVGGSMIVELRDNTGTLINSVGPFPYPAGSVADPVPVTFPLNLPVPVGTGWRIVSSAMSGNLIRETSGNTYPYVSASGNVSVTSGFITNPGSATYYWFYNWLVSTGCESERVGVTASIFTEQTYYQDADGDGFGNPNMSQFACIPPAGYVADNTDCDDTNPNVNPGATEICNGIDDNCDGNIDEGLLVTLFQDSDGDGFGNPNVSDMFCPGTPGWVADNTDCDDTNAAVNPAATEICNGIDDNCNGLTDDADPGVTGQSTWYADADGDGFGNPDVTTLACSQPAGFVANNTDCDDTNPNVNPNATEICNGIDDNCDGQIDEGLLVTLFQDADGDGYGNPNVSAQLCPGTPGWVADNTDCDDTNPNVNPGATEICNGIDDNCDGQIDESGSAATWYQDADGDGFGNPAMDSMACAAPAGYVANNLDCDDTNPNVNPNATEICNGIDDNCNGQVDEGVGSTFYADADGDGFGDPDVDTIACAAPIGYVADNTDCDDTNPNVNPGATEICNGIDDNCNGQVDEGVGSTFYADADGDGFGDPDVDTIACAAPIGYVADNTDCDDTNASVNPGATEICNGIDDNCDGQIDEGVGSTFYADADGDGFGNPNVTIQACTAPMGYVANNTDCDDTNADVNPNATEVCNGIDDNCDGQIDEGLLVTLYEDTDGDSYGNPNVSAQLCPGTPGWVADNTDCDDTNASVNPGATEICNGIDDNCDGQIDEGVGSTFYADADGDGFGDPNVSIQACTAPMGYVADNTDCDDTNADVNPNATEACNGIDDNCNGLVDDNDPGVTGQSTWYADADGDGFGNPNVSVLACAAPQGYVADNTDCDDTNAGINPNTTWYADADGDGFGNPNASLMTCDPGPGFVLNDDDCDDTNAAVNPNATEICNGMDDNCDGQIDEGVTTTFYADTDGDGFGDPNSSIQACSAPAGYVADNTDCDDTNAAVNPNATEVCNGIDDNCDGVVDDIITAITTSNISDCDDNGNMDPDDDFFTADVTVTFTAIPAAGTLDLTGDGTASVPVGSLAGNSYTFTGVTMIADGSPISLTATFSADPACGFTNNIAGIAPINCSGACFATIVDVITTEQGCPGVNDGTITIIAFGSSSQLGYSVNGGQTYQLSNYFGNLAAGTYNVTVIVYGAGCTVSTVVTVGGPTGTGQTWYKDVDGDGYSDGVTQTGCTSPGPEWYLAPQLIATSGDCNDYDADEFPGQTWYKDLDNDGYSDGVTLTQCSRPTGYKLAGELIATSGDCNDNNPNVNPAAVEICNGIDDNCDGEIDEGLAELTYIGNVVLTSQAQVNAWNFCYTVIQGNLTIKNAGIVNVNTLTNLRKVTGNVLIELTGLDSLAGLTGLDTVGGNLTIKQNFQLETLSGIDGLTRVGGNLAVFFNLKLSDCCAIYDLLNDPDGIGGTVSIYTNKTGCDNVGQVNTTCAPGPTPIVAPIGGNSPAVGQVFDNGIPQRVDVFPNPATDWATVRIYESFNSGTVKFLDMQGRLLRKQELDANTIQYRIELSDLPHGTYLVQVLVDGEQFVQKLVIE